MELTSNESRRESNGGFAAGIRIVRPEEAFAAFKSQTPKNILIVVGIFVFGALFFSQMPFGWLCDIALIAALYYAFFDVLQMKPIGIQCQCHGCGRVVLSNTPWVCGFCGAKNQRVTKFPFLKHCESCGTEQKAYRCHHCNEPMFFTLDQLKTNHAYCLNLNTAVAPVDPRAARKEEQEAKKHEFEMAEWETRVNAAKKKNEPVVKKTFEEEIRDDCERFFAKNMGREDRAEEMRKIIAEKYKGDKKRQKRAKEVLDDWLREEPPIRM